MTIVALAPIDLAALLCSRVCHDAIGPVGAIVNGLEVLEDEKDPQMREVAVDLIKKSAASASARLQFCRLAFGAAGSMGAAVDTGDAESVTRGLVVNVDWTGQDGTLALRVEAKGPNARLAHGVADLLAGRPQGGAVDAHTIQPFFAGLVARDCGMEVAVLAAPESVTLEARPAAVK